MVGATGAHGGLEGAIQFLGRAENVTDAAADIAGEVTDLDAVAIVLLLRSRLISCKVAARTDAVPPRPIVNAAKVTATAFFI
ncbi:hypothetical protein L905_13170 [Agrobacterium sp. TS43]|nr:hypothetical protein L905_13170 [Agrobacterium sp. TS43]